MPFPYQGRKTNCNLLNFRSLKTFAPGHSFHLCPDFCCCSGWLHTGDSDWVPVCLQLYFMASQLLLHPSSFLLRCSSKVACMQTTTFESGRTMTTARENISKSWAKGVRKKRVQDRIPKSGRAVTSFYQGSRCLLQRLFPPPLWAPERQGPENVCSVPTDSS